MGWHQYIHICLQIVLQKSDGIGVFFCFFFNLFGRFTQFANLEIYDWSINLLQILNLNAKSKFKSQI